MPYQNIYSLLSVLILAVSPSLIWLFFYLKEDPHQEPKIWIFIIFIMGVALAPIVIFLEMSLNRWGNGALIFVIAPIIEEIAKYGIVHLSLNKNPVLNEPVDGMIYIIVAALGFAAIENVFAIFSFIPIGSAGYLNATLNFMSMRFISAVALHGLASGIAGYYFSKFYFMQRNPMLILKGLFFACLLHGMYNFLIMKNEDSYYLILTGFVLGGAAALVIYLFNRLKHYKAYQQVVIDGTTDNKI